MNNLSIIKTFTTHLKTALVKSFYFAQEYGHEEITIEHLLYGLAVEKGSLSSELLSKFNFPIDLLKQELIRKYHSPYLHNHSSPRLNKEALQVLTKAVRTAQLHQHTYIGTEHALACLLDFVDDKLKKLFDIWQINLAELGRQVLVVLKSTSKFPDLTETLKYLQHSQEENVDEFEDLPTLKSFGQELTDDIFLLSAFPLIGREKEIKRLQQIIGRRHKNNPLLIGKAGVGKTAIVEGLARAIVSGKVGNFMHNRRIFSLELSSLVAGTMYRGEFEQRMKQLVDEIKNHPEIILFIDEIHTLVGAGSTGQPLDAANILKPALARGDIHCIGATTWDEFQKHLSKDHALTRRFQTIPIEEPNEEQAKRILFGVKPSYEQFHNITITKDAIDTAISLSGRYLTHTCWPDKALDLIDEAASQIVLDLPMPPQERKKERLKNQVQKLQKQKGDLLNKDNYKEALNVHEKLTNYIEQLQTLTEEKTRKARLSNKHIRQVVALRTGIPIDRLTTRTKPISEKIYHSLQQEIIGQDKALHNLAQAIQRGYSPLKQANKPLGAYLFLGPSGVGKTSTAQSLARQLFGSNNSLIRLDMSEFSESFTISKLIGAPAGYVGYQESGQLANAIRQKPLSVVLFDEVEKAHPDIFNLLLQILDHGKLSDGSGQDVDFRHALIILTSNLGLDALQHKLGFDSNKINENTAKVLESAAKNFFRLELLNRLDDIIFFEDLGINERQAIIKQKISLLNKRLGDQIELIITEEAVNFLAATNYNQEQGVRSLEKNIREFVEIPLSETLWKAKKGTKTKIDLENKKITIQ